MGVRFESGLTTTALNSLPASNADTVLYFTGPLLLAVDSAVVSLQWMVNITTGTGTTALVFHLRRGSTTSGLSIAANNWTNKVTAGNTYTIGGCYFDQPGPQLLGYCLTIQQTNATGAGTLNDGSLMAFVL